MSSLIFYLKDQEKRGFTIIEIIVAVTFILILSGIGLANYINLSQIKQLEADGEKLVDILTLARNKSISGDRGGCTPNFYGYRLQILSNNSYSLRACCQVNCSGFNNIINPNPILSSNVVFNVSSGYFQFDVLGFKNTGNLNSIRLQHNNLNKCITVNVDPQSGIISKSTITDCP